MKFIQLKIPPPLIGLTTFLAMATLAKLLPEAAFAFPGQKLIAIILLLAGLVMDVAGLINFRRAKTTINPLAPGNASTLVTRGVYRFSRNPMYLGMLLMLAAMALFLGNMASMVLLPLFVPLMNYLQILPEEQILADRFGGAWSDYSQRVRRWL